jgi:hypothetical protein
VAAVVTVVIIAVVVKAIKVVFRPDSLRLSILGGSVYTTPSLSPPSPSPSPSPQAGSRAAEPSLSFSFKLRAENPSGRVRMYYLDIIAYLFNSSTPATTPAPMAECLVPFEIEDTLVKQTLYVDIIKQVTVQRDPEAIMLFAFDALYKTGGTIKDVTMRVDGTLVTEIRSGFNTTPQLVSYYCRQLVVGPYDDDATTKTQEITCTTS